ncbi:sterol carrier family protein [Streptomyces sp. NPDC059578]|uniref:maleylpyruvate isomerase family mycothiol-dependent enzyme n=1 Tax=Streptomyces sp. NPDC059578 TaxID=3346874 RepID=UPI00369DBDBD
MPPASKRVRSFDPARTRAAVLTQYRHVRAAVAELTPEQFAEPTRLGDWMVRDLAAHLSLVLGSVARNLELPEPARQELTLDAYPAATSTVAGAVDTLARSTAAEADAEELFARAADRVEEALAGVPDERIVPTRFGAMRLSDFLVTRVVELVVHTDDLNDAIGPAVPIDGKALAITTRFLADVLALKAPGGAVEVRVPPYAVVQCVEGPRHTRGTPPNVVETDPLTWIRLATGRTDWAAELGAATVSASGERADLTELLPLLG